MRKCLLAAACGLAITGSTEAAVVYQNTANAAADWFSPKVLDDVTASGGGPVIIQAMDFGVENWHPTQSWDVDAVVTFWDSINAAAGNYEEVRSGNLGSFRRHLGSIAASTPLTTGMFTLDTPVTVADGSFGVEIAIYATGSTSYVGDEINGSVYPMITGKQTPTVGSSSVAYWSDVDWDSLITGFDKVTPSGGPDARDGLYLQINAVPEPASLGLVCLGGFLLARRRRS